MYINCLLLNSFQCFHTLKLYLLIHRNQLNCPGSCIKNSANYKLLNLQKRVSVTSIFKPEHITITTQPQYISGTYSVILCTGTY